jgi:NAD(P)-dependent dehydrogenase (short-subunit alcohol dehydrogenase family)
MTEQTVVVTGASRGIGRATARAFRDDGWTVYATARDEAALAALAEAGCETAELDVTDAGAVDRVVSRVVAEQDRLDCLVNNAGIGVYGPLEDVTTGELVTQFDVNVFGPHRLTRAVLPHMRAQGEGTIVNVSSTAGLVAGPGMGAYSGSKFAMEAMSDALRGEVDDLGIDVVLVEPGPVDTDFDEGIAAGLATRRARTSGDYDWVYDLYADLDALDDDGPGPAETSPEAVALIIREAACMANPPTRYPVGPIAGWVKWARVLPDGVVDFLYRLYRKVT